MSAVIWSSGESTWCWPHRAPIACHSPSGTTLGGRGPRCGQRHRPPQARPDRRDGSSAGARLVPERDEAQAVPSSVHPLSGLMHRGRFAGAHAHSGRPRAIIARRGAPHRRLLTPLQRVGYGESRMTHRIVSLIASATEIVCALGFEPRLVGRSHECDHPPGALRLRPPGAWLDALDGRCPPEGGCRRLTPTRRVGLCLSCRHRARGPVAHGTALLPLRAVEQRPALSEVPASSRADVRRARASRSARDRRAVARRTRR